MKYATKLALVLLAGGVIVGVVLFVTVGQQAVIFPVIVVPLLFYLLLMLPEYGAVNTPAKYFLVDRKMRAPEFRQTYIGTNVGLASCLMFSASLGYWYGVSAMIWGPLTWGLGIGLYCVLFPKIIPHLKRDHTLHGFLANRFSSPGKKNVALRVLTSSVTSLIFWALMSVEIYMATIVLQPIMGKTPAISIAVGIAVVAFVYSYIAGYAGVCTFQKIDY